ncbi:SubName: Full=Uncharacterized protein {ECO:0000313/EMBL:CCA68161.1} [Serendipita indica DSM 11827]|uniref:Uncharacterized protein n=1 Tax=Serendipita indica (strain DSM 11827) TaxID=1109443 RepID=G4TA42_SERID|nr:SubName: Full=Uncharacterized protein {ECO:0000313/EMBL:CCA68161.1} [Serendipita indica DSM 11827]CCA68161.1 hypothetical protein PIIN_02027 [Serendipita indica DSM 11827]
MRYLLPFLYIAPFARAHIVAWVKGMYCVNGTTGTENQNTYDPVVPLYNLTKSDWWMHHSNKCDQFPPAPGDFLDIPSGGNFTVELAGNRAFTTLSYGGRLVTAWGDGKNHPDTYSITNLGDEPGPSGSGCLPSPNLHAQNETMAAGTAFAISYQSELARVTLENLVVFTVLYHTPFKRLATYSVPAGMPSCPPEGCICTWLWVPDHCGEPNIYMHPYRCKVSGRTGTRKLATAKPPVWCEDDQTKCVKGAKQMVAWNQLDGNNVILTGKQRDGLSKSPGYNMKMGFSNGAQTDIFEPVVTTTPSSTVTTTATSKIVKTGVACVSMTPVTLAKRHNNRLLGH